MLRSGEMHTQHMYADKAAATHRYMRGVLVEGTVSETKQGMLNSMQWVENVVMRDRRASSHRDELHS